MVLGATHTRAILSSKDTSALFTPGTALRAFWTVVPQFFMLQMTWRWEIEMVSKI